jgi:hypothetical protein
LINLIFLELPIFTAELEGMKKKVKKDEDMDNNNDIEEGSSESVSDFDD